MAGESARIMSTLIEAFSDNSRCCRLRSFAIPGHHELSRRLLLVQQRHAVDGINLADVRRHLLQTLQWTELHSPAGSGHAEMSAVRLQLWLQLRARKLPPGISTSWSMSIGQSRWGAPINPFRGGFPRFSGSTGRNNPSCWANISISRSKTLSKFPKWGLRPQNFDPSMSLRALLQLLSDNKAESTGVC
jgi:hypothetical protein